jgi:tetratricopeptide (TPR) repeat protein
MRSFDDLLPKLVKIVAILVAFVAISFGSYYAYFAYLKRTSTPAHQLVKVYEEAVRKNPLDVNLRVQLGEAYLAVNRPNDAIKQFKEALKIEEDNQGALVGMGKAYMQKNQYDKAKEYFKKEIRYYETAGMRFENRFLEQAYYNMAIIYWKKKDYENAIMYAKKAASGIGRGHYDNFFLLGRIYLDQKNYKGAKTAFEKVISLDPKFADGHYGLGLTLEKIGEYGKAVEEFNKTVKLAEGFKDAEEKRDSIFSKLKENVESSRTPENLYQLGTAYTGLENYEEAIELLQEAIKKKPDYVEAVYALGRAYEKKEDNKKAKAYYEKALEIRGDYEPALAALKRMKLGLKEEEVIHKTF